MKVILYMSGDLMLDGNFMVVKKAIHGFIYMGWTIRGVTLKCINVMDGFTIN